MREPLAGGSKDVKSARNLPRPETPWEGYAELPTALPRHVSSCCELAWLLHPACEWVDVLEVRGGRC